MGLPRAKVHRLGLRQPHVAIDSRAFVEPAFAGSGVHAHHQYVAAAIDHKSLMSKRNGVYPLSLPSDEQPFRKMSALSEGAVELEHDPPA